MKMTMQAGLFSFILSFCVLFAAYPVGYMRYSDLLYTITRYSSIVFIIVTVAVGLYLFQEQRDKAETEQEDENQAS